MAKKLDFSKRRFDGKKKMAISDENERFEGDRAAKWLKAVESSNNKLKSKKA